MFYYAQLDENKIVVGISQLSGEVDLPNMIRLEEYDSSLCGKKYEDGKFIDMPAPPPMPLEPTQQELTEELLLETKYQTALLEML